MQEVTQNVWHPETGITEPDQSLVELLHSEISSIEQIWAEQKERLKGTIQLTEFVEQLSREWAIETGVIENLYEIDRGLTQTLIEHGFRSERQWACMPSLSPPVQYTQNLNATRECISYLRLTRARESTQDRSSNSQNKAIIL